MVLNVIATHMVYNLRYDPALYDARLTRVENQLKDQLWIAIHALQAAQFNRLALDYLSPSLIKALFPELTHSAEEFGTPHLQSI